MGAVVAVVAAIGSAIASAAVAVASIVSAVISAVASAVAAIGSAIYGAVSSAISAVTAGISSVASSVASAASSIVGSIGSTLSSWAGTIASYAESIYSAMQAFAEAIHLKTILTIHNIAYIVSADYREMMNKVYRQFAEVSRELGLGAQFLNLAIRNARSVVLDVSAMMGKSYDLAEVTWLKSLSKFSKRMEGRFRDYQDRPEVIFDDIDEFLLRDSVDAGSSVQRTIFTTVKSVSETIHETVQDVATLRDDLDKFVSDLPKEIREEIKPYVDPITERVDEFLTEDYRPYKQKVDAIIGVLDNNQKTVKNRVDGIVDRLTRPGDVLRNVDSLPIDQRITQENRISEVSARSDQRQADNLQVQAAPTWEHLQKVRQALLQPPPPPEYIIRERKRPVVPAGQQSKEADTWFVGDY